MGELERTAMRHARSAGLEDELLELVEIRASQLNGCAFCLNMHAKDARKLGMGDRRIDLLPAWRETEEYSRRERAALEMTEAVTFLHDGHVPDAVCERAAKVFSEAELASLVWAATTINAWNRLAVTSRAPVPSE